MALKPVLSADEFSKIPEGLQSIYVADGDSYRLDVEGGIEDVSGLKSALEKQKEAARLAKSQGGDAAKRLEAMELLLAGLGGEEGAAKLQDLQGRLEKDELLRAMSDGNLEMVSNKLLGRNNADWQKKYSGIEEKLKEAAEALKAKDSQLKKTVLSGEIQREAAKLLIPDAISDAVFIGEHSWDIDESGGPIMRNKDGDIELGKDGKPLKIAEWLDGQKDTRPYWFAGSSGGGTSGGRSNGGRQAHQLTREDAKDFGKVQAASEAAQKAGLGSFELIDS